MEIDQIIKGHTYGSNDDGLVRQVISIKYKDSVATYTIHNDSYNKNLGQQTSDVPYTYGIVYYIIDGVDLDGKLITTMKPPPVRQSSLFDFAKWADVDLSLIPKNNKSKKTFELMLPAIPETDKPHPSFWIEKWDFGELVARYKAGGTYDNPNAGSHHSVKNDPVAAAAIAHLWNLRMENFDLMSNEYARCKKQYLAWDSILKNKKKYQNTTITTFFIKE